MVASALLFYNKKYISQAKKNILNGEYEDDEVDEDEFYEGEDISRENIEMYKAMIDEDRARAQKGKKKKYRQKRTTRNNSTYPSIVDANDRLDPRSNADNLELREEIDQIKSMLNDAKKDLASYKCPTAKEIELNNPDIDSRPRETLDRKELPDSPLKIAPHSTIIDPVKSI